MKKGIWILGTLLSLSVAYLLLDKFTHSKKLVYINTPKLLNEYKGMKAAQKELEGKAKEWTSKVDTLQMELEAEMKKYEADRSNMSAKEMKLTEELLRNKQQQFMQYQEAARQKVAEEDQKIKNKIFGVVNDYLKEYGKQHNYQYILGATANGNLVYAEESLDITADVVEGLNQNYKGK